MRLGLFIALTVIAGLVVAAPALAAEATLEITSRVTSEGTLYTTSDLTSDITSSRHIDDEDESEEERRRREHEEAERAQARFMKRNFLRVMRDAAVGHGEHLAAMGTLFGCPKQFAPNVYAAARAGHAQTFAQTRVQPTLAAMRSQLRKDRRLASQCRFLASASRS